MNFNFDERLSDSPFVEKLWRTQSERSGSFTSTAASNWEMVITTYQGKTTLTVRGPETKATPADCPADAEFFGIVFKLGTFMPHLLQEICWIEKMRPCLKRFIGQTPGQILPTSKSE